jgi:hypothetical protein
MHARKKKYLQYYHVVTIFMLSAIEARRKLIREACGEGG